MQPVSAYQYFNIGTVGTAVLTSAGGVLKNVVIPGTYVGTVVFSDASAITGTSATNRIVSFGLPASGVPNSVELNWRVKNGLVYEATGTPVMTVGYN